MMPSRACLTISLWWGCILLLDEKIRVTSLPWMYDAVIPRSRNL